jgi:ribonuclease
MKTINWGDNTNSRNPLGNSSLSNLSMLVSDFRLGRLLFGWRGNQVFKNRNGDLPIRAYGYYKEFYLGASPESGSARIVLGQGGEVYVTGDHNRDFFQVLDMPVR